MGTRQGYVAECGSESKVPKKGTRTQSSYQHKGESYPVLCPHGHICARAHIQTHTHNVSHEVLQSRAKGLEHLLIHSLNIYGGPTAYKAKY